MKPDKSLLEQEIAEMIQARDEALLSLDKAKIWRYMIKYHVPFSPSNETVFWAGVHKAILSIRSATAEQKCNSEQWLHKHGFRADPPYQ